MENEATVDGTIDTQPSVGRKSEFDSSLISEINLMVYKDRLSQQGSASMLASDGIAAMERNANAYSALTRSFLRAFIELGIVSEDGLKAKSGDEDTDKDEFHVLSNAQKEAIKMLPLTVDQWEFKIHGKCRSSLLKYNYVTIEHGMVSATNAALEQLAESINTEDRLLLSEQQKEAFVSLAKDRNAFGNLNGRTRNLMIKNQWITSDGRFTEQGIAICQTLEVEIVSDQTAGAVKPVSSVLLTESQRDALLGKIAWNDIHGKTKTILLRNGWFSPDGKITEKGLEIRATL